MKMAIDCFDPLPHDSQAKRFMWINRIEFKTSTIVLYNNLQIIFTPYHAHINPASLGMFLNII